MGVRDLIPSVPTALSQIIAFAGLRAPQWGTGDRNFLGKLARGMVILLDPAYRTMRQLDADWPPSVDSSESALRRQANIFGVPNGAGGYGFRVAQASRGARGIITGTGGVTVNAGETLVGQDGSTRFQVRSNVTTSGSAPGTGQVEGTFDAITVGSISNLSPGAKLRFESTPAGIDPEVTITVGTSNTGKDEEDAGSAQRRLGLRLQLPPKGGAAQDYAHGAAAWCENAYDSAGNPITGIRAYGFNGGATGAGGGYDGTGAVMVVITFEGSGISRLPTTEVLDDILTYVRGTTSKSGVSPISHSFRVIAPFMDPLITGLTLRCRTVPSRPDLAYDWVRGATTYTVSAWDGVSKLTLDGPAVGTGTAPLDLKTAIDNGQRPRIFVDTQSAGAPIGPIVPPMARCTAWADAAGKTTLTLELPLPVTWQAPSVGDEVFSGQAAICDAAEGLPAAILAYVDGLGPSRVSGLYDPNDFWADVAAVSGVESAATSVLGSDGLTPLIERTIAGSTMIGVGINNPTVQDVEPPDNSTFGPGLWFATRILVTD